MTKPRPKPKHRTKTDRLCYELDTIIAGPFMQYRHAMRKAAAGLDKVVDEVYRIQGEIADIQDRVRKP